MLGESLVSFSPTRKGGDGSRCDDVPRVLTPRMRKRAKTCKPVLYSPFWPEPHCGRASPSCVSRRSSSARIKSVEIEDSVRSREGAMAMSARRYEGCCQGRTAMEERSTRHGTETGSGRRPGVGTAGITDQGQWKETGGAIVRTARSSIVNIHLGAIPEAMVLAAMGACRAVERDDGGPEIWLESIDGVARDGALSKPSRVLLTSLGQNSTGQIACRAIRSPLSARFFFVSVPAPCPWHGSPPDLLATSLDAVLFLQVRADATCPP